MALTELEATFQFLATAQMVVSQALLPGASKTERTISFNDANLKTTNLNSSSTPGVGGDCAVGADDGDRRPV